MTTTSSTKQIKHGDMIVSVDRVFSEDRLDKLSAEFCFHNFPTPFDEQANSILLTILVMKYFTDYPFTGNLSHYIVEYEDMIENGLAAKISQAINKKELSKVNKAIKKGAEHTQNIVNYLADINPEYLNTILTQGA